MPDLVRITASGIDRVTVAQKLLDAAGDDVSAVRTVTGGFVVEKSLAQKAGVLEGSGPAEGFATLQDSGITESETGFTTSTENGPSPEGRASDSSAKTNGGDGASPSPADEGQPSNTAAQADDGKPAEEKARLDSEPLASSEESTPPAKTTARAKK